MQMSASIDQLSVNHPVAGSSPARGANKNIDLAPIVLSLCCFGSHQGHRMRHWFTAISQRIAEVLHVI